MQIPVPVRAAWKMKWRFLVAFAIVHHASSLFPFPPCPPPPPVRNSLSRLIRRRCFSPRSGWLERVSNTSTVEPQTKYQGSPTWFQLCRVSGLSIVGSGCLDCVGARVLLGFGALEGNEWLRSVVLA